jgi:putative aldouronate transport system substrate-binding protein
MARAFKNAKLGGPDTFGWLLENKGYGGPTANWGGIINAWNAYIDIWQDVGGKAVWSSTQPEMRQALLNMQALYKEGIFNQDFAVIDSATARQYISTGKVGIAASGLTRLVVDYPALYMADPKADTWSVIPTGDNGSLYKVQVGQNTPNFAFVSTKTKNPEAVVELANLTVKLNNEDPVNFFRSDVGGTAWPWFKYNIMGGINISGGYLQIDTAYAVINYEKTKDQKYLTSGPIKEYYDRFTQGKTDRNMYQWVKMYEDGGSASAAYDAYHAGRMVESLFYGIPSDNMQLKQKIINDELKAAMDEVVMGANITVYDAAVRKWFADGGQDITNEVNAWYQTQKK